MEDIAMLFMQYQKAVYCYLYSLTKNAALAEDLCSETFLKALQSLHSFKGNSSIKTWLYAIARNQWLMHLRKEKADLSYEDCFASYIYNSNESLNDLIIAKQIKEKFNLFLNQKDRITKNVVLQRLQGFSYEEIAQANKISQGSARVIDFRFKQWIKEKLSKEGLL